MSLPYLSYLTASCLARKPSAIRALLPLTKLPGMISLAGGMPNPETFPITRLAFDVKAPVPGQPDQTVSATYISPTRAARGAAQAETAGRPPSLTHHSQRPCALAPRPQPCTLPCTYTHIHLCWTIICMGFALQGLSATIQPISALPPYPVLTSTTIQHQRPDGTHKRGTQHRAAILCHAGHSSPSRRAAQHADEGAQPTRAGEQGVSSPKGKQVAVSTLTLTSLSSRRPRRPR